MYAFWYDINIGTHHPRTTHNKQPQSGNARYSLEIPIPGYFNIFLSFASWQKIIRRKACKAVPRYHVLHSVGVMCTESYSTDVMFPRSQIYKSQTNYLIEEGAICLHSIWFREIPPLSNNAKVSPRFLRPELLLRCNTSASTNLFQPVAPHSR